MVLVDNTLINQNLYTMKKLLLLFSAALTMLFTGCTQFDDTRIWDAIDELEDLFDDLDNRVEDLEEACEKMNTNIEALQTLVAALQANDTITSIAPIKQGDKVVGYTISFSKSEPITIYHGNDGKDGADGEDGKDGENGADGEDGYTPQIGIAKDSDNVYYWTLDGEWLLDENGNKIKAVGTDGKDGEDGEDGANGNDGSNGENGENGENGADGKDGITPQLEIRDGYWYISYDNGATWKELGKATGEDGKDGADGEDGKDGEDGTNGADGQDGKDGDSLFQSVTWDEEYAYFTLADGTVITIPLSDGAVTKTVEVNAVEMIGLCADNLCMFVLTDSGFNHEAEYWGDAGWMSFNSEYYVVGLVLETIDDSSVVPQGTFTSESGEIDIRDGSYYEYLGDDWDDWYDYNFDNAVVIVSEDKIEATFTLENGEVHHVIYEGSLELYFKGITDKEEDNVDGDLPPANEIWYTSTDGEVVEPYCQMDWSGGSVFGSFIVSNTYENGKGVIVFDGDVTSIGEVAFAECESLASVTIPDSVTSIGYWAFTGCSSLTSVTIPDSVTSIRVQAFYWCESLASVIIPESVTEIGGAAFEGCSSLASVTIPDSVTEIGNGAFRNCPSLTSFYGKYASEDGRCLIVDGTLNSFAPAGLTEYTIPDSVTSIGDSAFFDCFSLTSVTIPDSVTSIGDYAFRSCSLASITIPDSVTSIGEQAFNGCSSLASVSIGNGVTSIGEEAFAKCYSLTSIVIPDSVTEIGNETFYYCSSLASVTIGSGVTSIGELAFRDCTSLTSVTIPDSVTSIGKAAFFGCWQLESVTIGSGVTSIGTQAFSYCESLISFYGKYASEDGRCLIVDGTLNSFAPAGLTEYTIPDSVTSIGEAAFFGCWQLESVTIGSGVTSIGYSAFAVCDNLAFVHCKSTTPPTMQHSSNYTPTFNSYLLNIYVPEGCVDAYKSADGWSDYADAIRTYAPNNYANWLGTYTLSGKGNAYDSESDSWVERDVEFTISVEAKDESTMTYYVTGWDGCSYPIEAQYNSENELILSAGVIAEGVDLGDSGVGDYYFVGCLGDGYIRVGGPIIKLSKDSNQAVGLTVDGNEVTGATICLYQDGSFYFLRSYGDVYTPLDMEVGGSASYAPMKVGARGGRYFEVDRTRKLNIIK